MSLDLNFLDRIEAEAYACFEAKTNAYVDKNGLIQLLRDEKAFGTPADKMKDVLVDLLSDYEYLEVYNECLENVAGKYSYKIFEAIKRDEELYNAAVATIKDLYDISVREGDPFDAYVLLEVSVAAPLGKEVLALSPNRKLHDHWSWKAYDDVLETVLHRI